MFGQRFLEEAAESDSGFISNLIGVGGNDDDKSNNNINTNSTTDDGSILSMSSTSDEGMQMLFLVYFGLIGLFFLKWCYNHRQEANDENDNDSDSDDDDDDDDDDEENGNAGSRRRRQRHDSTTSQDNNDVDGTMKRIKDLDEIPLLRKQILMKHFQEKKTEMQLTQECFPESVSEEIDEEEEGGKSAGGEDEDEDDDNDIESNLGCGFITIPLHETNSNHGDDDEGGGGGGGEEAEGEDENEKQNNQDPTIATPTPRTTTTTTTMTTTTGKATRMIPNTCAICLDTYRVDDTIVWSSNGQCCHVFHKDCILSYLSNTEGNHPKILPCPCCRQSFCILPSSEQELFQLLLT